MNMKKIEVSVIIVNYNTLHVLEPCIDSIVAHTHDVNYEIIVVDNGSNDGSIEVLKDDERLTLIVAGKNLGFGKANNIGLEQAQGEYIFFLNADTLLKDNAIKMFYDFATRFQGRLGALGCILEDQNGCPIHSYGKFPQMSDDIKKLLWIPALKALHLYKPSPIRWPNDWMKVDYVTGADLFMSRKLLNDCGTFHPAFFMYYEETELEHRLEAKGYQNIVVRGPHIIHLEGEGGKDGRSKFIRDTVRQQESEYIYFKLTEPRWKYLLYRIVHPLLRQTVWLNPHITFADKLTLFKKLFIRINIQDDEHTR